MVSINNFESFDFDLGLNTKKESFNSQAEYELAITFEAVNKTIYDLLNKNCFTNINQWIDKWNNDNRFLNENLEDLEIINLIVEELYDCESLSQFIRIESKYKDTLDKIKVVEKLINVNVTLFHEILNSLPKDRIRESVTYSKISQLNNELLIKQGLFQNLYILLNEAFEYKAELND